MKRIVFILSCLLLIACTSHNYGEVKVNLDKALRQKTSTQDLYVSAEVLPLCLPDGVILPDTPHIEVTDSLVFLLDAYGEQIVVLDTNGSFVRLIGGGMPVTDFSTYKNQILDILYGSEVKEYNLDDFSLIREISLPADGVTLTEMQRRDDDVLWFAGFQGEWAYDCAYYVGRDYFSAVKNPVHKAADYQDQRFFRCNDSTFFSYRPGVVMAYTSDDFIFPMLILDFGKHSPVVKQAQMTSDRLYLQLDSLGEEALLVYDRSGEQHRLIKTTSEGLVFPLGVIHKGVNFFCSPARQLDNYVPPGAVTLPKETEFILLKYNL